MTYFSIATKPVGQVFAERADRAQSVGVIGLGVGTLAVCPAWSAWVFTRSTGRVERIAR